MHAVGLIVLRAGSFGIYGNAVVNHGYSLMSLYSHLSSVDVSERQEVARVDTLGRKGETDLAGGDPLHFAMFLHGLPANPVEWRDDHRIEDRLRLKLGKALKG